MEPVPALPNAGLPREGFFSLDRRQMCTVRTVCAPGCDGTRFHRIATIAGQPGIAAPAMVEPLPVNRAGSPAAAPAPVRVAAAAESRAAPGPARSRAANPGAPRAGPARDHSLRALAMAAEGAKGDGTHGSRSLPVLQETSTAGVPPPDETGYRHARRCTCKVREAPGLRSLQGLAIAIRQPLGQPRHGSRARTARRTRTLKCLGVE